MILYVVRLVQYTTRLHEYMDFREDDVVFFITFM